MNKNYLSEFQLLHKFAQDLIPKHVRLTRQTDGKELFWVEEIDSFMEKREKESENDNAY